MKQLVIAILAVSSISFAACNSGNQTSENKDTMSMDKMAMRIPAAQPQQQQ